MTPLLEELAENPEMLYRMSVDEYHRMIESGAVEEGAPFELLDGHLVHKIRSATGKDVMTVSPDHATAVMRLAELNTQLVARGCHIRTQQPVTIPPHDEPEPDAAIVRGGIADYAARHPGPQDILCLIEVSDASLRRDRGYKFRLYASAQVVTYVIVNLSERVVEVYTQPLAGEGRYVQVDRYAAEQPLELPAATGDALRIAAKTLLP